LQAKCKKKQVAYVAPTKTQVLVTKAPTLTQAISTMPTGIVSPTPTTSIKKVAQLANTSGDLTAVVFKGDSFWKITRRVCGDGKYYRITQEYNGYTDYDKLHEGDVVTVICHE
jgi:nucleoid-associated protein YgaU